MAEVQIPKSEEALRKVGEVQKQRNDEYRVMFEHLDPRPISYAQMVMRNLEWRFGEPKETKTGNTQQLEYRASGTIITLEVRDVGLTSKGVEGRVKIYFYSEDKKSIEAVINQKGWDLLDLKGNRYFEVNFINV